MSPGKRYTGLTIDRSSRRSITIVRGKPSPIRCKQRGITTDDTRVVVDDLDAYIHDPITQQRKRDTVREKVRIQRAARSARERIIALGYEALFLATERLSYLLSRCNA